MIEEMEKNDILLKFYEHHEKFCNDYQFKDHQTILPFKLINSQDSMILSYEKQIGFEKSQALMMLLALKQNNFTVNYLNSKNAFVITNAEIKYINQIRKINKKQVKNTISNVAEFLKKQTNCSSYNMGELPTLK